MRLSSKPLVLISCLTLLWILLAPPAVPATLAGTATAFDDPANDNPAPAAPKAASHLALPPGATTLRQPARVAGSVDEKSRPFQQRHPAFTGESRAPPSL